MNELGLTVLLYALGLASICVVSAVGGRVRPRPVTAALGVLEVGALAQAGVDIWALTGGRHSPELATHIGYLLTSIAIIPITVATVRLDPGRWGSVALAVGCVLLAIVTLRLHATLDAGHG